MGIETNQRRIQEEITTKKNEHVVEDLVTVVEKLSNKVDQLSTELNIVKNIKSNPEKIIIDRTPEIKQEKKVEHQVKQATFIPSVDTEGMQSNVSKPIIKRKILDLNNNIDKLQELHK